MPKFHKKAKPLFLNKTFLLKRVLPLSLILLVLIFAAGLFIKNYLDLQNYKNDRDTEQIKQKLAKHFILPDGDPVIATITDADKLKSEQSFYKNAKNDDKVFIWKDKALIYRPSEDRIVDFGIIINSDQTNNNSIQTQTTPTITATETKAKVVLLNGTTNSNLGVSSQDTLSKNADTSALINNIDRANAKNNTYKETTVVDFSGKFSSLAQNIAKILNGKVATDLPAGETKPANTDIVIILGTNTK